MRWNRNPAVGLPAEHLRKVLRAVQHGDQAEVHRPQPHQSAGPGRKVIVEQHLGQVRNRHRRNAVHKEKQDLQEQQGPDLVDVFFHVDLPGLLVGVCLTSSNLYIIARRQSKILTFN